MTIEWPGKGAPHEDYVAYWKAKVGTELAEAQAEHDRVCSELDGNLLKVAQYHRPMPGNKELFCAGCDLERDNCAGPWPCPTWKLIVGDDDHRDPS